MFDYVYYPAVSLVGGSASSPSAGGSTTVTVNDSCVVCRWPLLNTVPIAVHVTTVSPIGNVSPDHIVISASTISFDYVLFKKSCN